jgi:Protein of unknown function (DUF3987)/Domain of unknown function (DUF3854)
MGTQRPNPDSNSTLGPDIERAKRELAELRQRLRVPRAGVTPSNSGQFRPSDLANFGRFRIPLELLERAQVERVTDPEAREKYGITGHCDMAGIVFPYFDPNTGHRVTARLRRDNPEVEDGKEKNKYISSYGDRKHLYFPPGAAEKLKDPTASIVLVESEKAVLALTEWASRNRSNILPIGLGGCWGWKGRIGKIPNAHGKRVDEMGPLPDLDCCDGRKVYVLLDANLATNPKVKNASDALIRELHKRNCAVLLCKLPLMDGVNGPDDFIAVSGDDEMTKIFDALDARVAEGNSDWPEPEPLGGELPPVQAFDAGLLPEALRPLVEDTAERMQVPPDYPAAVAVLGLAGVVNRRAMIQPKAADTSWVKVPNLWGGIVAPPGLMKSPLISAITQPFNAIEAKLRAEYDSASSEYEQQREEGELRLAAWKEQYKTAQKSGKAAPARPDVAIAPPTCRRLITHDATAEKLHEILRDNPAGVLVIRDELSGWLATLDKPGREGERGFFLSAWNGDTPYTMDRIGRGSVYVEACCVSMLGGIQPARLRNYITEALQDGPLNDGLLQRFQVLVYPDITRDWHYVDRPPDSEAIERAERLYQGLVDLDPTQPLRFRFNPDAQQLFIAWFGELEAKVRSDGLHPALMSHLAKYRSLMPSLSLLFELADGSKDAVSLQHARQAAAFCEYLESHARRVYSMIISRERQAAAELGRHLQAGWKRDEGTFTVREIYRNCWASLDTAERVRPALDILSDAGWIRRIEAGERSGRPSENYAVNPCLRRRTR